MKLFSKILLFLFSFCFICFSQTITESAGTASVLFLRNNYSARVSSLGNTFTGMANDNNAFYYNPAGLVRSPGYNISINHTQWYENIKFENISAQYKINNKLAIGVSLSHMWMPGIESRDQFKNPIPDVNVASTIMQLSASYVILSGNYIGFSFKYFTDHLAYKTASGMAFDIAYFMYTSIPNLTFGTVIQNIGPEIKYDEKNYEIPLSVRSGIAYHIKTYNTTLLFDINKSKDTDFFYSFGSEYTIFNKYTFRIGNQIRSFAFFNPAGGFGIKINNKINFNYSIAIPGELGFIHSMGIDINMDNKK